MRMRELTPLDSGSPELWHLLWLACESDDATLLRLRDDVLPTLTVVVMEDDVVVGFVAYRETGASVTIEYIATSEEYQGRGIGGALIAEIRRKYPDVPVFAETDDDAIGFYRKLGCVDERAPQDERWPDRRRYRCVFLPEDSASLRKVNEGAS